MDLSEGTTKEDLWTPFKELVAVVEGYLAREGKGAPYSVHTFETVLRRHKQSFLSFLKNPPKNPTNRDEIRRGVTEGVILPNIGKTLLSKELVEEAIILSDMYSVNEYLSLELVHSAARQSPRHPGLARGLVAVLLYYDGRRALAMALRELVMASDGVCWSVNAREEILKYVTRYVDQLVADGLLTNTLDALKRFTLTSELELLQNNRALPPKNHHGRLVDTIESTRKMLAGVIFAASAQRGLPRDMLLRLITEESKSASRGPTGALDDISLALQMSLLYGLDLSVLHRREDGEELAKRLPLVSDPTLLSVLVEQLSPSDSDAPLEHDNTTGLRALCQLALGLALAALKRAPQSLLRASGQDARSELFDQDEALVDAAIDGKVFEYLDEVVLPNELVHQEEYYQRRLHTLITDFIVLMHSKLMEMRVKADESVRAVAMYQSSGVSAPAAASAGRAALGALLRCVERLYAKDPRRLRADYWAAGDAARATPSRAATLYKFVRGAEATLAANWVRALAALTVEKHTWALLSRRDLPPPLSAQHMLAALARYRQSLRTDASPLAPLSVQAPLGAAGLGPPARQGRLLVRHEEVEAMIAALKLLAAVAREDPAACTAICENLQWDTVNVMFGLICCHVPLNLKAELCLTLSALGGTSATALRVWAALEASQIVSMTKEIRGLTAELQEVESRIEEYPLSRAFLRLMLSLSAAGPVPRALGAGSRRPGLDPYVDHVIQRLTLPAPHRAYAKPQEKWQMLSLCLELLCSWLCAYSPSPADLPGAGEVAPPPGLHVALRLHAGDDLLRLVLNTLKQAVDLLPAGPTHKEYVESSLLSCLVLLERGLCIERELSQAAAEAGRSVLVVGLSKLILAPDSDTDTTPLVTVCRVLQHCAALPAAAARALALLSRALASLPAARNLMAAAAHKASLATEIRYGFVECLEAEEWGPDAVETRLAKERAVALIQQTLPTAAPNLAHLLLGYHISDDVSRSSLNEPGVIGFPQTCLHSILDILEEYIAGTDNTDREASELVESCYRLIYSLCSRANTSQPILRFLRSRDNFLCRHLKAYINLEKASASTLWSRSWAVRACSCEAGAAAATRHHAALASLNRALAPPSGAHAQECEWWVIRQGVSRLQVSVEPVAEPRWELLHSAPLRQAIAACDLDTGTGGKRISVPKVHAMLSREMVSLQATAPQMNLLAVEIQKVLDYVTEINNRRNLAAVLTHYYDSWRQLTEILFCVMPPDLLNLENKKNLLLNILQDLLNKIPPAEVLPQIGNLASGTVLLLLVNLRHCYITQKRESNLKSNEFETTFFGPSNQIMQSKSLTLKYILNKILSWILVSGGSTQKMRVHLYGALLNFLNIVNLKSSPAESDSETSVTYVSRLDSSKGVNREESALKSMVMEVISEFGDNLCSIVCSDCIGAGHDVCRMVALSCLDTLIEINPQTDWMNTLTNQGYLRSLIDSLLQDDEGLQQTLEPNPKSLRVLYVYESKMSLLIKIAMTVSGAGTVLSSGALACLGQLRVLDRHPDTHTDNSRDADFMPSVANRFRQILLPALKLCDALLTTLGTQNHSCIVHVHHFLLSHLDCIDMVLRAAHPNSPAGLLVEVQAITSVIARASDRDVCALAEELNSASVAIARLKGLMLALLPRFSAPPSSVADEEQIVYYKIVCNILTYARNTRPWTSGAGAGGSAVSSLLCVLQGGVRRAALHRKLLDTVHHQRGNLHTMTLDDMKKLVGSSLPADAAPGAVRSRVQSELSRRAALRRDELAYCQYAIETALYLTWAYLQVYLRDSVSVDDNFNTSLSMSAALHGAHGDDLPELKKGLLAAFNDRFTEELIDTAKNQPQSQRGFLEVLLKDIKTMIQFNPL